MKKVEFSVTRALPQAALGRSPQHRGKSCDPAQAHERCMALAQRPKNRRAPVTHGSPGEKKRFFTEVRGNAGRWRPK
ncbi:MAG TPA: hypothetical protein PKC59_06350, partial [Burkholderiaceae bacterium]|nr:hypothetical protein [Burkholderiaceae bacterium]